MQMEQVSRAMMLTVLGAFHQRSVPLVQPLCDPMSWVGPVGTYALGWLVPGHVL